MSAVAAADQSREEKYEVLLNQVRKMMLGSSARLFLRNLIQTTEFEKVAHAGFDWPCDVSGRFSLDDPSSISAKAVHSKETWLAQKLDQTETSENLASLFSAGHKHVLVVKILRADGNCFATLMITSMDDEPFPTEWDSIIRSISIQLTVILQAIYAKLTEETASAEYFAHSVKTRIDRVNLGGKRLLEMLGPLYGDPDLLAQMPRFIALAEAALRNAGPQHQGFNRDTVDLLDALKKTFPLQARSAEQRRTVTHAYEDLSAHLRELRTSAVGMAGGKNEEHPDQARPATWTGTPATLRGCLLQSLKPLSNLKGYSRTLIVPDIHVLAWDVRIRIPEQILVEVLNNLLDNALKYDFNPPSVSLQVFSVDNLEYVLQITNDAPRLGEQEADQISFGGHRARYAEAKNYDGTGLGLRFAIDTCRLWGLDLTYEPARSSGIKVGKEDLGRHTVKLKMKNIGRRLG